MPAEEPVLRRALLDSSGLSGIDNTTILALIVMALVYFLAPCAGYQPNTRGALLAALWFLFIKVAVGILRAVVVLDNALSTKSPALKGEDLITFFRLVTYADLALFALSLLLFLIGLSGLRRGVAPLPLREERRPYND